jgi:hypothetical protein
MKSFKINLLLAMGLSCTSALSQQPILKELNKFVKQENLSTFTLNFAEIYNHSKFELRELEALPLVLGFKQQENSYLFKAAEIFCQVTSPHSLKAKPLLQTVSADEGLFIVESKTKDPNSYPGDGSDSNFYLDDEDVLRNPVIVGTLPSADPAMQIWVVRAKIPEGVQVLTGPISCVE